MISFQRGNSQRKAGDTLPHKEPLSWQALPDDIFKEFKGFFEECAKDGRSFYYRSPNDNIQRQWIIAPETSVSYQAINHEYSTLTVQIQ